MKHLKSNAYDLRIIFENNLTVAHISESLISRDASEQSSSVRQYMVAQNFDEMGVSVDGKVVGYVKRDELRDGSSGQFKRDFSTDDLLSDSTPLFQVLQLLRIKPRYFVLSADKVAGIVMRGDLQKAPVRMLLFSLVTLVEMHMLKVIRLLYSNDDWQEKLKPERLQKAKDLLAERQGRNEAIDLADCLQLGDKFDIVRLSLGSVQQLDISAGQLKNLKRNADDLRNHLAHGQDLVTGSSWEKIIDTAVKLENLLKQLETAIKTIEER